MKTILPCLLFVFILALLGCSPQQEPVPIMTTRPVIDSLADTPTPLPTAVTETLLPPTFTSVPPTAKPSQTPASATTMPSPEPTAAQLPIATVEPFTQGSILILWNEATPPAVDGPSEFEPTVNLYLAKPGSVPEEWQVQPLLTGLRALTPAYLSPDQTKLAFLNNDLEASWACMCDFYKIQVYNLADRTLIQIDNPEYLDTLSWLADSQSIIYPQESNVFLDKVDGLPAQQVSNYPTPLPNMIDGLIGQLAGSPDGRFQAITIYPHKLALFNIEDNESFQITNELGRDVDHLSLKWSPDSQWLAFTSSFNEGLFVTNVNTLEVIQLSLEVTPNRYFPAWSPDSKQLAFSQQDTIFLWDSETYQKSELTNSDYISEPSWSPDGSLIAAGFIQGEQNGVMVIDPVSGQRQDYPLETFTNAVIWSPDGQWLLFQLVQSDQSGLYVMSAADGVPYLVLDTSGKLHVPGYITWLSSVVGQSIEERP